MKEPFFINPRRKGRRGRNPGAAYHTEWRDFARTREFGAKTQDARNRWKGYADAHEDSREESVRLGMNPKTKKRKEKKMAKRKLYGAAAAAHAKKVGRKRPTAKKGTTKAKRAKAKKAYKAYTGKTLGLGQRHIVYAYGKKGSKVWTRSHKSKSKRAGIKINPRRGKRRNPFLGEELMLVGNPRRRRPAKRRNPMRKYAKRRSPKRSYRRNPILGGLLGGLQPMKLATMVGVGGASVVVTSLAPGFARRFLPASIAENPIAQIGSQIAASLLGSFVIRKYVKKPEYATIWLIAGLATIGGTLIRTYVLPMTGLSEFLGDDDDVDGVGRFPRRYGPRRRGFFMGEDDDVDGVGRYIRPRRRLRGDDDELEGYEEESFEGYDELEEYEGVGDDFTLDREDESVPMMMGDEFLGEFVEA